MLSGGYVKKNGNGLFHNILLVGGPGVNKISKMLFDYYDYNTQTNNRKNNGDKKYDKNGGHDRNNNNDNINDDNHNYNNSKKVMTKKANSIGKYDIASNSKIEFHNKLINKQDDKVFQKSFKIGPYSFADLDDGIIFTFPLVRSSRDGGGRDEHEGNRNDDCDSY
jgi:hypothetical protein